MSQAASPSVVPYSHFEQLREARNIIAHEGQALLDLARRLDASFCSAVETIVGCRGCVIVTGIGKAGLIGQKLAATMSSTGTRAFFLHPTEAFHGDLGCLAAEDVLLVLSYSGETEEVCRLLPFAASTSLPVIALTADERSTLGRGATVTIALGRLLEAGLHGLPPTTSTTAMLAAGDALALVIAQTRGFTPQEFGRLHPGGSLGRRLTPVRDVMRRDGELRVAFQEDSVRNVFTGQRRSGRRTGAVILVDDHGRLSGLFTDSDLARLLEQRRDEQLDRPICEVMTARPITIGDDAILEEAVAVMSAKRLSELPVVDAAGRPLGLIDITDVIGLMPAEP